MRPFDVGTAEGRSKERYRRALLNTLGASVSKVISVAAGLISVPLTLSYLGPERYGLWMTISAVIGFLAFSDLGISNGLLNGISRAHGNDDRELARQYVSSAFFFLVAIALTLGACFSMVYGSIQWSSLFRVRSPEAMAEAGPAAAVFLTCFLVNIPASIVNRVQSGYQEGFIANLWASLGSAICLLSLLIVIHFHGSLPWLVLAMAGSPIVILLLNGLVEFSAKRPWLRPSYRCIRPAISKDLLHLGSLFFVLQLAMAIGYSSDNIVLARIIGPHAVAQYAVPSKLFNLVAVTVSFLVTPLWPAYGEALARKDFTWIRKTLYRFLVLAVIISAGMSSLLAIFGARVLKMWVGSRVEPDPALMLGLAVWSVLSAASTTIAMFCNGLSIVRFQVCVASIGAVSNILLSIFLTRRLGISGVVYGSIISQTFLVLIPYWFYLRRYIRENICAGQPQCVSE